MQVDKRDVALFIRLDLIGTVLGIGLILLVNGIVIRNGGLWIVLAPLVLLIGCLVCADRALVAGRLFVSLLFIAVGNWIVALSVPILLPFLWPIMVLTVVMPLVLASPHLTQRQVIQAIATTALIASGVAAIGLINDDGGVIEDIDDWYELALVVGSLAAQIAPIGLIARLHNQRQLDNLSGLQLLNTNLRQSETELAASRDRVVQAADSERRRIERDLHDGAQQRLVALGVRLRLIDSQGDGHAEIAGGIQAVIAELDEAIQEIRELAHGIYPPLLQTRGLPAAIAAVARRSPQPVTSDLDDVPRMPESVETALYFAALESLTNAAKHAPEAAVLVRLEDRHGTLVLTVTDDGHGFDTDRSIQSHGFNNMRDRLAVVGGNVDIVSAVGSGTTVTATVPFTDGTTN